MREGSTMGVTQDTFGPPFGHHPYGGHDRWGNGRGRAWERGDGGE